jgi:hypothetical protein
VRDGAHRRVLEFERQVRRRLGLAFGHHRGVVGEAGLLDDTRPCPAGLAGRDQVADGQLALGRRDDAGNAQRAVTSEFAGEVLEPTVPVTLVISARFIWTRIAPLPLKPLNSALSTNARPWTSGGGCSPASRLAASFCSISVSGRQFAVLLASSPCFDSASSTLVLVSAVALAEILHLGLQVSPFFLTSSAALAICAFDRGRAAW